ncbi:MAG: hypothetical protein ACKPA7_28795, partial [Sphaerospermopsis kisseleviana]
PESESSIIETEIDRNLVNQEIDLLCKRKNITSEIGKQILGELWPGVAGRSQLSDFLVILYYSVYKKRTRSLCRVLFSLAYIVLRLSLKHELDLVGTLTSPTVPDSCAKSASLLPKERPQRVSNPLGDPCDLY